MNGGVRPSISRRAMLASGVAMLLAPALARAEVIAGALPWRPSDTQPPEVAGPGAWRFFTPEEGAAIEALVDRLIPADPLSPGGKDIGCAIFIDRQLAGGYGQSKGLYMRPPFQDGKKEFGPQSPQTPVARYRVGLAALDRHCKAANVGKPFAHWADAAKDELIAGMEKGTVQFANVSARAFFELLLQNTTEGFFADPVYGGNRDMAAWKMIGFPGARYDYRDWVERHNERYPLPPVGISGRPEWAEG